GKRTKWLNKATTAALDATITTLLRHSVAAGDPEASALMWLAGEMRPCMAERRFQAHMVEKCLQRGYPVTAHQRTQQKFSIRCCEDQKISDYSSQQTAETFY
ncbi:hypothetical protein HPP92_029141, partial [Vanilla planifolia]